MTALLINLNYFQSSNWVYLQIEKWRIKLPRILLSVIKKMYFLYTSLANWIPLICYIVNFDTLGQIRPFFIIFYPFTNPTTSIKGLTRILLTVYQAKQIKQGLSGNCKLVFRYAHLSFAHQAGHSNNILVLPLALPKQRPELFQVLTFT